MSDEKFELIPLDASDVLAEAQDDAAYAGHAGAGLENAHDGVRQKLPYIVVGQKQSALVDDGVIAVGEFALKVGELAYPLGPSFDAVPVYHYTDYAEFDRDNKLVWQAFPDERDEGQLERCEWGEQWATDDNPKGKPPGQRRNNFVLAALRPQKDGPPAWQIMGVIGFSGSSARHGETFLARLDQAAAKRPIYSALVTFRSETGSEGSKRWQEIVPEGRGFVKADHLPALRECFELARQVINSMRKHPRDLTPESGEDAG